MTSILLHTYTQTHTHAHTRTHQRTRAHTHVYMNATLKNLQNTLTNIKIITPCNTLRADIFFFHDILRNA
jgi:hypothetical protein